LGGVTDRDNTPSTPEENEHANRQPGPKGHPHQSGPTRESADRQPEESLKPEHRQNPSGLLDNASHRPGPRDLPERKP
jgi:hypothetical protein